MREMGKDNPTEEQIIRIQKLLAPESQESLRHDARLAPAWIGKILLDKMKKVRGVLKIFP